MRPSNGQLNDGGFDSQRYALSQHRPLTGRLSRLKSGSRNSVCERVIASLNLTPSRAATAIGDAIGVEPGEASGDTARDKTPDAKPAIIAPDGDFGTYRWGFSGLVAAQGRAILSPVPLVG